MAEQSSNLFVEVDGSELQQILDDLGDKKREVDEANGALRAALKEILEDAGWNKKALQAIRQIDAMSETQRADFLRTFKPMFEALYAHGWAFEVQDLVDQVERA